MSTPSVACVALGNVQLGMEASRTIPADRRPVRALVLRETTSARTLRVAEDLARRLDAELRQLPSAAHETAGAELTNCLLVVQRRATAARAEDEIAELLHVLECPTLVLPRGWSQPIPRRPRCVCAVDSERPGRSVVRYASLLAAALEGSLVVTTVAREAESEAAAKVLARCMDVVPEGLPVSAQVRPGRVVGALQRAVRAEFAAMLAVGRPRHRGAVGAVLGSAGHALVRNPPAPLLVVPPVLARSTSVGRAP